MNKLSFDILKIIQKYNDKINHLKKFQKTLNKIQKIKYVLYNSCVSFREKINNKEYISYSYCHLSQKTLLKKKKKIIKIKC